MQRLMLCLTGFFLLTTNFSAYGQSKLNCPKAPDERQLRCARVSAEIADSQREIERDEDQLRNPTVILARVEKRPDEPVADYRARVRRQQGVATPRSNTWHPVQGHYYNASQRQMFVALARDAYWHYLWEGLAFDPQLAKATFRQREQLSRSEKSFQLQSPDSAANQRRYRLESLLAFQRECCTAADPQITLRPPGLDKPEAPLADPPISTAKPASAEP